MRTSAIPMIGRTHRTLIQHFTGSACIAIKDCMQGFASGVVGTEDAMAYRVITHGTLDHKAL
jgi:hypothetical protein